MYRRHALRFAALAVASAFTAPASAGSAVADSCSAPGSTTLVHHHDLRIYKQHGNAYACSTRFGRHVLLRRGYPGVDVYARAGRSTLAYVCFNYVASRSLRTGRLLRHTLIAEQFFQVTALVTKRDGSLAYIYTYNDGNSHVGGTAVWKDDTGGTSELDSSWYDPGGASGNSIDTSTLYVVGNTVHWIDSSTDMSAPFS